MKPSPSLSSRRKAVCLYSSSIYTRPVALSRRDFTGFNRRIGLVVVGASNNHGNSTNDRQTMPDSLVFQADVSEGSVGPAGSDLVQRAEATISDARAALKASRSRWAAQDISAPEHASVLPSPPSSLQPQLEKGSSANGDIKTSTPKRTNPGSQLRPPAGQAENSYSSDSAAEMPEWASSMMSGGFGAAGSNSPSTFKPELQPFKGAQGLETIFAEPASAFMDFRSQEAESEVAAQSAELPPLQSVLELTTAFKPPNQGEVLGAPVESTSARNMPDGKGSLADGTVWEKSSGEERGYGGYWKRWTSIKGISNAGNVKVEWEEKWWEISNWSGMRELGAEKSGCRADGSAWQEEWVEHLNRSDGGEPEIHRRAQKWAREGPGLNEWEESWNETYKGSGYTEKHADKWAKESENIWHERWGEKYDGQGWCHKYTDKWAERQLPGGLREQWGDKWEETFGDGSGFKKGETWSIDSIGNPFNRWWGEDHLGDGHVRKHGSSTAGEHWDVTEQMDTYYNPVPHFGFHHAWHHSPGLRAIQELPRDSADGGDDTSLGAGFDAF